MAFARPTTIAIHNDGNVLGCASGASGRHDRNGWSVHVISLELNFNAEPQQKCGF
jgi:hypothetical protein